MSKIIPYHIIALAPNPWDGPWMNRQQLLSRLGEKHHVLYTNGLLYSWDRLKSHWPGYTYWGGFKMQDNVIVDLTPKILLRHPKFDFYDRKILKIGVRRWKGAFHKWDDGPTISYLFHPEYWPYVREIKSDFIIYHAYDLFSLTPGWNELLENQQKYLLERADLILASSDYTANELRKIHNKKTVHVLYNGVDYKAYSEAVKKDEAQELTNIAHPRIGYAGRLNLKVDFSLISELAIQHPQWQFVFIGDVGELDDHARTDLRRCKSLSNIHFLGYKNRLDMPDYVAKMDVNIMCYRTDETLWTKGIYPLKLHEYLAVGKPVVSSDLPTIRTYADVLTIANNMEEWQRAITAAINEKDSELMRKRQQIAMENDWDCRVAQLNEYLDALVY